MLKRQRQAETPFAAVAIATALMLVGIAVACTPREEGGPAQGPVPVPISSSQDRVLEQCRRVDDFVTTQGQFGGPTEIVPGVTVIVYPRVDSRRNGLAAIASGNIIAKIVKTGENAFPAWGLSAGTDTSCWLVGQRGGTVVARFVSPTADTESGNFAIRFHPDAHDRDSASVNPGRRLAHDDRGSGRILLAGILPPVSALRSLVSFPQGLTDTTDGGGHAWSTCITNGCCMAGY